MDRILDKLRSLQSSSSSLFLSMGSIPCNVKLPLLEVTRVDTRYGPSVCVTLQLEERSGKGIFAKALRGTNRGRHREHEDNEGTIDEEKEG